MPVGYPAPRRPGYLLAAGRDEATLRRAAERAMVRTSGRGALGLVKPGDVVLLVVPPYQDIGVLEAIIWALARRRIRADAVNETEIGVTSQAAPSPDSPLDGWKEVMWRDEFTALLDPDLQAQDYRLKEYWASLVPYLDAHPKYTMVYAGSAGRPQIASALATHTSKFVSNWTYATLHDLVGLAGTFPSDVLALVEAKVVEAIPRFDQVRITDPQGTDLFFEVTEDQSRIWQRGAFLSGHLFMYPLNPGSISVDLGRTTAEQEELAFPAASGVIAGTANHLGFYPHMIAHVEDGVIHRLEGGGRFGVLLREIMQRTKHLRVPRHPRPGLFYVNELGLGTNPKEARSFLHLFDNAPSLPNHDETKRSGVLHWGIGIDSRHPEVVSFAKEHKIPDHHMWHFHNYLTTYRARVRGSGEWVTLLDRGRITALDLPEVRHLAEKHGDPDEILREDWIPAIPGINYVGDYQRDFGSDPARWVRTEIDNAMPATVGVPGAS